MFGKRCLFAGASVAAVFSVIGGAAGAQTVPSAGGVAASEQGSPDRSNATQVQEVVVTGSRIARPNLDQPTPVSTLSPETIQNAGTANLGDVIALLPAVGTGGTTRSNSNFGGPSGAAPGTSEIDLRNLGVRRTLVLVDGQRHVSGDIGTDAVDVNSIPSSLVDHVEIITGGASAIYGSDAVSGVVNIILKHDFEGFEAEGQAGEYDAGYGTQYNAYVTAGHNFTFFGGHANITASAFINDQEGIEANEIPYNHNYGQITNPKDLSGPIDPTFFSSPSAIKNDGIPDNLTVQNVGSDLIARNGVLLNPATFQPITGFLANGTPVAQPGRLGYNSFSFAELPGNCQSCYFADPVNQVLSPNQQRGGEIMLNDDINPHLHAFVDAKYVDSVSTNYLQGDFSFGAYTIAQDNAFITPQLATTLAPLYAAGAAPAYAAFLDNNRAQTDERRTARIVAGLRGDVDLNLFDLKWDGALNYGETATHQNVAGLAITQNFVNALDSVIDPATGQAVCRSGAPGCAPYDPFGTQQSAAAQKYVFARLSDNDHLSQEVANVNFNVDSRRFFNLQGGPIGVAFGGEYRMERTFEKNSPGLLSGETDELAANSAGGFNVYEGYTEVNLPLLRHFAPGLDEVTIDGAYRDAQYSTVGNVDAYKVSAVYGPVSWLKFRGTYSRAVRAPDITEAYSPVQGSYFNVSDPCSAENIQNNVNYAKNCAAAGIPSGFVANTNASIKGQSSGNPNLNPERSLSYTGGIILQPPIIPHLSVTVDYYSILIKDAITLVQGQDILNNCYNSSSGLDSQYCSLFTRDPTTHNINFIQNTYVNAAELYTDGVEVQADYRLNVAPFTERVPHLGFFNGVADFSMDANYVMRLRNFPFQTNPGQYNVLENGITTLEGDVPSLRMFWNASYKQGPVEVAWRVRYVGRAARYDQDPTQADFSESTDQPYAGAKWFHDITLRYDLPGPVKGFQVFFGVNDLFGETPPLGLVQGTGSDALYDLGRYIYGGIKFRH